MNWDPFIQAGSAIQIHAVAATYSLFIGAFVLWRKKGTRLHRNLGKTWVAAMLIVAFTGFFIHEIRLFGPFSPIHLFSVLVPISLFFNIRAARCGNIAAHRNGMKATYVGGMVFAGGFTFLPGRLNYEIFFGAVENSLASSTFGWGVSIGIAVLIALYYQYRVRQARIPDETG